MGVFNLYSRPRYSFFAIPNRLPRISGFFACTFPSTDLGALHNLHDRNDYTVHPRSRVFILQREFNSLHEME